jgi:hypothetical protein
VRDKVSHLYKTTDKSIVLYILIFILSDSKLKTKDSGLVGNRHSLNLIFS